MEKPKEETDERPRGMMETIRCFWCRTTTAVRAFFTRNRGSWEPEDIPSPVSNRLAEQEDLTADEKREGTPSIDVEHVLNSGGDYVRKWEVISQIDSEKETKSCEFLVASYNVLCQENFEAMPNLYKHLAVSSSFRTWPHRWTLLSNEITALDADILGMQEVSRGCFDENFQPLLASLGYTILFDEKTNEQIKHGLVLAVKRDKFDIELYESVNFYHYDDPVLDRGNIGQIARLNSRETGASLLVSNTHLVFNPFRGDTKFAQIATLMARIHQCRRDDEPVICLGDFNIEQGSKIYEYITTGHLDASSFSIALGSGQIKSDNPLVESDEILFDLPRETYVHTMMDRSGEIKSDLFELLHSLGSTLSHIFSHRLNLTSAYAPSEVAKVSTYHADSGNPDIIFFDVGNTSSSSLSLIRRLSLPSASDLVGAMRWPNETIPSDHICLLAQFSLSKF